MLPDLAYPDSDALGRLAEALSDWLGNLSYVNRVLLFGSLARGALGWLFIGQEKRLKKCYAATGI